jgi:calpain-7
MIIDISSRCIKQTVVPNCSFVSSLAISADFEKRCASFDFRSHLPVALQVQQENHHKLHLSTEGRCSSDQSTRSVLLPCSMLAHCLAGKYLVKLFLNGVWRKIVIDDTLPLGINGSLLCAYSTNPDEMWVSIIEKAYLKVGRLPTVFGLTDTQAMGGYDFPGSNSGIDLFALSGWIPERIPLKVSTVLSQMHLTESTTGRH